MFYFFLAHRSDLRVPVAILWVRKKWNNAQRLKTK